MKFELYLGNFSNTHATKFPVKIIIYIYIVGILYENNVIPYFVRFVSL